MAIVTKFFLISLSVLLFLCLIQAGKKDTSIGISPTISYFKLKNNDFKMSLQQLKTAITAINKNDKKTILQAKNVLINCRIKYKQIEFFTEYFLPFSSNIYNRSTNVEVEEPNPEFIEPIGLQVIESLLFDFDDKSKPAMLQQIDMLLNSANDLNGLLFTIPITDQQILESARLELIRIMALGIAGYDAPQLKTGISESFIALQSLQNILQPYLALVDKSIGDSVTLYLNKSLSNLNQTTSFLSFNRLSFLVNSALPLQFNLGKMIKQLKLEINTKPYLNYKADNLFNKDFFNFNTDSNLNKTVAENRLQLGKQLFFDPILSGNGKRSCASCHSPEKYFTDGLVKNTSFTGNSFLLRNTPSLFYTTYQHTFFLDARSNSLEAQIKVVVMDKNEMNGDGADVAKHISANKNYMEAFKKAFPKEIIKDTISFDLIAKAIASYEKSLAPRNSAFDKYMAGNKHALTNQQITGFNIFMGKAQCGTCHFAPLFNSLLPPNYEVSELEILGTPKNDNFKKPQFDYDSGHYSVMPEKYNVGSFKTPTVRNAALTAPYMHNGSFKTLKKVVEFYNKGGGQGIGLPIKYQTLSSKPLKLTNTEIQAVVSFINALTDSMPILGK